MKNLTGMAIFARVVEERSFSAAARRLGLSKSMVSKEVTRLEQALGVRLLNRTTRKLSLTEIGAAFYEPCARILQEAHEAELLVGRLHAEPRGVLRLTAPVAFGTLHVAPALPEFLAQYPDVRIDLTIGDRNLDLAEEGLDLAIRIARVLPDNLVARRLAPINRVVCAAPAYFERHGMPRRPQDLARHNCLVYTHANPDSQWRFRSENGEAVVAVKGNLTLNDDRSAVAGDPWRPRYRTFADVHRRERPAVGPVAGRAYRARAGGAQPACALSAEPAPVGEGARVHRLPRCAVFHPSRIGIADWAVTRTAGGARKPRKPKPR
jgi:DNA-binding transcriptional LysR family regulator